MTEFNPRHFLWRQEGRVGIITLNRPEKKNPLTFESYAELRDLFRALADRSNQRELTQGDDIRSIVLTGAGGNFCSGGDVHEIIGPLTKMNYAGLLDFTRMTGDLVKAMRHCPQPIVAAVDGDCAGAGATLVMASDLRYATARSKTAFLFARVAVAGCDMGACAMLPRIVGQGRAAEWLFSGRSLGGDEAERWGFLNRVVEPGALLAEATAFARQLADGPSFAHSLTKAMLHQEWSMDIDTAIEAEAQAQALCMLTQDFGHAYRAFAARSRPVFEGR